MIVLEIIDVNGRLVSEIANEKLPEGNHEITFDRHLLPAGIYFLKLRANEGEMVKKMLIE